MECADVATSKVKAMAINLIIFSLHVATVGVGCHSDQDRLTHGPGDAKTLRTSPSSSEISSSLLIAGVRAEELRGRKRCEVFVNKDRLWDKSPQADMGHLLLSEAVPPSSP